MLDRVVDRLHSISGRALFWGSVAFSEALTLAVVSVMSLAFHGRIAADYLVTGAAAGFVVSSIVVWIIMRLLTQLRETAESLAREADGRERTVRELRESEDRYRALVEYSPFAIVAHRGGEIFYANPAAVELLGGSRAADLVGRNALELVHPDYREIIARRIRETQREGKTHLDTMEQRYIRLDGRPIDVEVAAISIMDGGRPATLVVGRDITGRKQAESDVARLGTAVEQGDLAVVITELDGTIVYVNPAFERNAGYSRAEAVGKNPRILKSGKHPPEFYREMWETVGRGEVWTGIFTNRRKDGSLYDERAVISPVRDARGGIVNYVAVKRDVTRDLQIERHLVLSQRVEAIGQLAGGVAHDFNNLLTVIIGYSEILLGRIGEADPLRRYVREINRIADRAALLTQQLLAFSRRQILSPRVLGLNGIVAEMDQMLKRLIGEDVDFVTAFSPGLWTVKADPAQIEQVVMNLAVNARDAMPGGGRLTIETRNADLDERFAREHPPMQAGSYALLKVSDTGIGMDEATRARIFEPFFTTKELGKGTGLGLATVYGIVKQSGGFIWVDSRPGEGSAFSVYLPRVEAEAGGFEDPRDTPAGSLRGSETILLVEDEEEVRETVNEILSMRGYTVLKAAHAQEAVEVSESYDGPIDLLLTDVVMPGMNGRELADRITPSRPQAAVLYMSGYTETAIARRGVLEAGTAFIQKPFTSDALARKVREALEARRWGKTGP